MRLSRFLPVVAVTLLAGCGEDPAAACFATADHAKYSDGKITSMCGCSMRQMEKWGTTEKDHKLLAAVIRQKAVAADERTKAQDLGKLWAMASASCRKD
ncbi:hypothetical protein [Azospirillum sp. sgz301742]